MGDIVQREFDRPFNATAVVATDGANATLVTLTVRNANGAPMRQPVNFDLWLSDATTGFGVTSTTASGAVASKTDGTTGKDLVVYITKKALRVQTKADGTYQLSITDTAKTAFKVCVQLAEMSAVVTTLATASYG